MTEPLPGTVSPYERFLEYQDRRRRLAAAVPPVPPACPPVADYVDAAAMIPVPSAPGADTKT